MISTETLGKLVIKIVAETKDAEEALKKIQSKVSQTSEVGQSSLHQFATATSQVGVGFTSLGRLATRAGSTITTHITAPLVAAGTAAAKTSIEFLELKEKTKIAFETFLGDAQKANDYMKELYEFAKTTPFSQETFYEAAKSLLAMGFEASEAKKDLEAFTNAAIATGKGAEGINTLTTAFGKMNASGKVTLESLNMITDMGVPAVRILANQLGVTTEEFFNMTKQGEVLASEALPLLIEGMEKGTDGAAGMTAAYGELASKMKNGTLTGALDSLHSAWRNFSVDLFNSEENFPKLINLVNAVTRVVKNLSKVFTSVSESTGPLLDTLTDLANKLADFLEKADPNQLRGIGDAILTVAKAGPALLTLGAALKMVGSYFRAMSGIAKIMESTDSAKEGMEILTKAVKKCGKGVNEACRSLISFLNPINLVKTGVKGLSTAFGSLKGVLSGALGALKNFPSAIKNFPSVATGFLKMLNPITLVKGAIASLKLSFLNLYTAFTLAGGGMKGVLFLLKEAATGLMSPFTKLFGVMTTGFAPVIVVILALIAVIVFLRKNWETVTEVAREFAEKINLEEKLKKIEEAFSELSKKLGGEGGNIFKSLGEIFEKIGGVVVAILIPAIGLLAGIFDAVVSSIVPLIDIIGGLIDIVKSIFDIINGILTGDGEKVKQGFKDLGTGIGEVFKGLGDLVIAALGGIIEGIGEFVIELIEQFTGVDLSGVEEFGKNIGEGIKNGWDAFCSTVGEWAQGLWNGLVDGICALFGIASPAANMEQFGQYIGEGIKQGWDNWISGVGDWAQGLWDTVTSGFGNIASSAIEKGSELAKNVQTGIENGKEWLQTAGSNLATKAKEGVEAGKGLLQTAGSTLGTWAKNGVEGAKGLLQTAGSLLGKSTKSGVEGTQGLLQTAGHTIASAAHTGAGMVSDLMRTLGSTFGGNLGSGIKGTSGTLTSAGDSIANAAKSAITSIFDQAYTWGAHMVEGLSNGISSMAGSLIEKAKSLAEGVSSYMHFTRPDKGPLREYETWMPHFIEGLTDTLESASPKLIDSVAGLNEDMTNAMGLDDFSATGDFTKNVQVNSDSNLAGMMKQTVGLMQTIISNQGGYQVVLDTGVVAGAMTNQIDRNLGTLNNRRAKGL